MGFFPGRARWFLYSQISNFVFKNNKEIAGVFPKEISPAYVQMFQVVPPRWVVDTMIVGEFWLPPSQPERRIHPKCKTCKI